MCHVRRKVIVSRIKHILETNEKSQAHSAVAITSLGCTCDHTPACRMQSDRIWCPEQKNPSFLFTRELQLRSCRAVKFSLVS